MFAGAWVIFWSALATFILLKIVGVFIPLRMSEEDMEIGDVAEHGHEVYPSDIPSLGYPNGIPGPRQQPGVGDDARVTGARPTHPSRRGADAARPRRLSTADTSAQGREAGSDASRPTPLTLVAGAVAGGDLRSVAAADRPAALSCPVAIAIPALGSPGPGTGATARGGRRRRRSSRTPGT